MKHVLILFSCLFSFVAGAVIIKEVKLSGNTKTKKSALIRWANIPLNQEISEDRFEFVLEKLNRISQLNLISMNFENDVLNIKVEDKWSLFPVPMITQSGAYYSRGMLLYENNFLGRLGTFAPGIFYTNSGINGIIYWQEDNVLSENWGMKVILLHKNDLTQFERNDNVVKTFESRLNTLILTPNYQHGNFDHKIGPIYMEKKVFEGTSEVFKSKRYGLYYRQHLKSYKKLPVLFDGHNLSFDFFYIPRGSEQDFLTSGEYQYIKPFLGEYLKFQIHFNYTNNDSYLAPKILGGNEGHRGYDRESFPTQWNTGGMLQFQKHLYKTYYSAIFYEYNRSKLIKPVYDGETLSENAVGLNLSYYFQKVSVPALILDYAYNIDDYSHHVLINVGLKL